MNYYWNLGTKAGYNWRLYFQFYGVTSNSGFTEMNPLSLLNWKLSDEYDDLPIGLPKATELTIDLDLSKIDSSLWTSIIEGGTDNIGGVAITTTTAGLVPNTGGLPLDVWIYNHCFIAYSTESVANNWNNFTVIFEGVQELKTPQKYKLRGEVKASIKFQDVLKRAWESIKFESLIDNINVSSSQKLANDRPQRLFKTGTSRLTNVFLHEEDLNQLSDYNYLNLEQLTAKLYKGIPCETNSANAVNSNTSLVQWLIATWRRHSSATVTTVLTPFTNFKLYTADSGSGYTDKTGDYMVAGTTQITDANAVITRSRVQAGKIKGGFFCPRNVERYEVLYDLLKEFRTAKVSINKPVITSGVWGATYIIFNQIRELNTTASTQSLRAYESTVSIDPNTIATDEIELFYNVVSTIDCKSHRVYTIDDTAPKDLVLKKTLASSSRESLDVDLIFHNLPSDHKRGGLSDTTWSGFDISRRAGEKYPNTTMDSVICDSNGLQIHHDCLYYYDRTNSASGVYTKKVVNATETEIMNIENITRSSGGMAKALTEGLTVFSSQTQCYLEVESNFFIPKLGSICEITGGLTTITEINYLQDLANNFILVGFEIENLELKFNLLGW